MDYYKTYVNNRFVEENSFISAKIEDADPPALASVKHLLPVPFWGGYLPPAGPLGHAHHADGGGTREDGRGSRHGRRGRATPEYRECQVVG